MAREFQVLIRNPGGALYSISVQSGESVRVDPRHSYRIIADGQPTLPDGTTIVRSGKNLRIRFAGGDELTILDWTAAEGATLDTRGARVFLEGPDSFGLLAEVQSGLTTPVGGPDEARLAATPGAEAGATAGTTPSTGAATPSAGTTPSVPKSAPAPAPTAPPSPPVVAGSSGGGGGGFGGSGILLGVLGLGALAGAAGGGGGGSSSGGGGSSQPQASAAPSDLAVAAASDSGAPGDRVTNDNTPTLTGRADANAAITVRNAAGTTVATATADASGNWNATPANSLPDGQQTLQVVANRGAGATDSAATSIVVTIDTLSPAAPTIALREGPRINSVANSDGIEIGVSGTLAAGDTVAVIVTRPDNTTFTVQRVVTAAEVTAGLAVVVLTAQTVQGSYGVAARVTDAAGNAGPVTAAQQTFQLDSIVPAAPAARLDPSSDSGALGDNITSDNTPTITGTGTAGDAIRVAFAGGTILNTTVATNGTWSVTPATGLANGAVVASVTATDSFGNVSPLTDLNLTIDTLVPPAPVLVLDPSSDSGVQGDRLTNDTTPTISGVGSAGDTIRVTFPGGAVLSAVVATNGTWSITPTIPLAAGAVSLSATATDPAGNVSPVGNLALTLDVTAPAAPVAVLDPSSDSGALGDNLTNDTTPTISGTGAIAGDTVRVTLPGSAPLTTTVAAGGTWSVTPTAELPLGSAAVLVNALDPAGNASPTTTLNLTINNVGPPPPVIRIDSTSDSGVLLDNITNDTTPTISGTGVAGQPIRVTFPGGVVLTTTVSAGGTWSVTPTTPLPNGAATVSATATDAAGNVSLPGNLTILIDTVPPAAPPAVLAQASDSGVIGDNLTNNITPTIEGTGTIGDSIRVTFAGGVVATATVGSDSKWSATPSSAVATGANLVSVTATDPAGNSSPATAFTLTLDNSAGTLGAPDLATASDSGSSGTDNITNVTTPTFNGGGAEAGATIRLFDTDGSTVLGTTTASGGGAWSITTGVLSPGTRTVTVRQTDISGNVSAASPGLAVTIDTTVPTTAPATPDLAAASDSGISNADNVTKVVAPTFLGGGAEAGATVRLFDGAVAVGSGVADASGNWIVVSSPLSEGAHAMTTRQTDTAGNVGAVASASLIVTIDTTAPPAPSPPDLAVASDSGTSSTDNITNVTTPTFTGSGDSGNLITLLDGAVQVGTATVTGGIWTIVSSVLSVGAHSLTALQTDLAGNTSVASAALAVTIDTSAAALAAPDLTAASDSGTSNIDNITNVTTPTFNGVGAEAGATITLLDGATVLGTAAADSGGAWSITTGVLTPATRTVTVTQKDVAGNSSAVSPGLVGVTIDTTAPAAPSAPDLADASDTGISNLDNLTSLATPTLTGAGAEAGATVTLFDTNGTTVLGSAIASGIGAWSITSSALSGGPHTLTAKQADVAGNAGPASAALVVTIDAAAPTFATTVPAVNEGFASVTLSSVTLAAADNLSAQGALQVTGASFSSGTGFVGSDVTIGVAGGVATVTRNGGAVDKNGTIVISTTLQDEAGNTTTQGVTITVNSVNDAPAGADAAFGVQQSTTRAFTTANFALTDASDSPANTLQSVLITTLPTLGTLSLGGVPVVTGQEIAAADIIAGIFTYTPVVGQIGAPYSTFTFQVRDNGGITNGGINLDATPNTITLNVTVLPPAGKPGAFVDPSALLGGDPTPDVFALLDDGSGSLALGLAGDGGSGGATDASLQAPASGGAWNTDGLDSLLNGSRFVP